MQQKKYTKSIVWLKNDLRINDHTSLYKAIQDSDEILLLYLFEPSILKSNQSSNFHLQAKWQSLSALKKELKKLNIDILVLQTEAKNAFELIKKKFDFQAIFSHQEIGTELTYARDREIKKLVNTLNAKWHEYKQNGVVRGLKSRDKRNELWWKHYLKSLKHPVFKPNQFKSFTKKIPEITLKDLNIKINNNLQKVNFIEAKKTLKDFLNNRSLKYRGSISSPNTAFKAGSRMSVHLAWGTISIREVFQKTILRIENLKKENTITSKRWARSLQSFLSRIHWHDHFIQRLESQPSMEFKSLNYAYNKIPYKNNPEHLEAWLKGNTGYPMIDACMRCLQETGFLNFRMRSMVTSFACHVLHLDWRYIMHPLGNLFLDYEPGIHISQLQMQAGVVGINTIRVYNPIKQQEDHDPEFKFTKKWIKNWDLFIPYATPIVDYKKNSKEMKDILFLIKKSLIAKQKSIKVMKMHGSRMRRKTKKKKEINNQLQLTI